MRFFLRAVLVLAVVGAGGASAQPFQDWNDVFRSRSVALPGPMSKPDWWQVIRRHATDAARSRGECYFGNRDACVLADWDRFLDGLKGRSTLQMIREVNSRMNEHKYIRDIVNWGVADYWETPLEFFHLHGDCEDFAIAKFYSLRRLGIPNDSMKIVVVYDEVLRIGHAVLAVRYDGDYLILDNLAPDPVPERMIFHYRAVYSVNETSARIHEPIRPR